MRTSPTCKSTSRSVRRRKPRSISNGSRRANRAPKSRACRNGMRAGSDPRATKAWWRASSRNSNASRRKTVEIYRKPLTAAEIKAKARELGADLVGIADGARLDASHITQLDAGRVIVLAKRLNDGVARIRRWDDRLKYYNDRLALKHLEATSLDLVFCLVDLGAALLSVPRTCVDPLLYEALP